MRYLAKRLRSKLPATPIVLARWGLTHPKKKHELALATGVSNIASNLKEAANYVVQLAQLTPLRTLQNSFQQRRDTTNKLSSIP